MGFAAFCTRRDGRTGTVKSSRSPSMRSVKLFRPLSLSLLLCCRLSTMLMLMLLLMLQLEVVGEGQAGVGLQRGREGGTPPPRRVDETTRTAIDMADLQTAGCAQAIWYNNIVSYSIFHLQDAQALLFSACWARPHHPGPHQKS